MQIKKYSAFSLEYCTKLYTFALANTGNHSLSAIYYQGWFGSSVGLEQQPSKLRVKGSSPFRITKKGTSTSLFLCKICKPTSFNPNRSLDCDALTKPSFCHLFRPSRLQWNPIAPSKCQNICSKIKPIIIIQISSFLRKKLDIYFILSDTNNTKTFLYPNCLNFFFKYQTITPQYSCN